MRALIGEHQPIPDRVDVIRIVLIGGNGLLVVENGRVRIALQGDRIAPYPTAAACSRPADQNRVVQVGGVVERQRYLVGVAVGAETHPRIGGALIAPVAYDALCKLRQLVARQYREARATVGRDARSETAGAAVGITILLVHADEVGAIAVVGAGRVDIEPRLDL